ncbi:Cof-type HAD-IIB family hydrolase [Streptococcus porcinus]
MLVDIKVFATDMDGTFLNSQHDYDRQRFAHLFEKIDAQQKHFVAISGNQYYQIREFFPGYADKMTIVGENGAYIVDKGQLLKTFPLNNDIVSVLIDYLYANKLAHRALACGEKSAYILDSASVADKEMFSLYYTELVIIESFKALPADNILKFSFNSSISETQAIVESLNIRLDGRVLAVETGNGNVDVIGKDINKGSALRFLLDYWKLSPKNLVAFGDSQNDLEMLTMTDNSYAMMNAAEKVKEAASFITSSNDDCGVMAVMEKLMGI